MKTIMADDEVISKGENVRVATFVWVNASSGNEFSFTQSEVPALPPIAGRGSLQGRSRNNRRPPVLVG
jgi:hypothetical protein